MNSSYSLGCTALMGVNKAGTLTPDADGYYTMILGALGINNSAGGYYDYHSSKQIFEASSVLQMRVKRGVLRGEYGHPKRPYGMPDRDYQSRLYHLHEPLISHHIRKLWLVENAGLHEGKPYVAVMGEVIPCGPLGPVLEKQIKNGSENVCFSQRAFSIDKFQGGRVIKTLDQVITYDYVNEPGIHIATKYDSPSLEQFSHTLITREGLQTAMEEMSLNANESGCAADLNAALRSMNGLAIQMERTNLARW